MTMVVLRKRRIQAGADIKVSATLKKKNVGKRRPPRKAAATKARSQKPHAKGQTWAVEPGTLMAWVAGAQGRTIHRMM